jgi:hypothetical protein
MSAALNRERFVKLLALAESDQDGEALSAVRKAAAMARAAGMSLGEAVGTSPPDSSAIDPMVEFELTLSRRRISELERKLCTGGATEQQLEAATIKGYQRGHAAGKAEIEREVKMAADNRVREVEAELEAYRPVLDWLPIAEWFAHKNQRGTRVGFARGVLLRAGTNKLTAHDQAELRKFAARYPSKFPAAPKMPNPEPITEPAPSGNPSNQLSTADLIRDALAKRPDRSDRDIARDLKCSPTTVGKIRQQTGTAQVSRSVQRGGQMYTMKV